MNPLLQLSNDGDHGTLWRFDDDGRLLSRETLHADQRQTLPSNVTLLLPGTACRSCWLPLAGRNHAQATAAARWALKPSVTTPVEQLHIALGPASAQADASRQVIYLQAQLLRDWLQRAHALGVRVQAAMVDYLLLPVADNDVLQIARMDACWLVRGRELAFSAEPELARQLLQDHSYPAPQMINVDTLARGINDGVNLLQGEFALTDAAGRRRQRSSRRLIWLATALLASPLLLTATQALRYGWAAQQMQAQSAQLLRTPDTGADASAQPMQQMRSQQQLPGMLAGLFDGVQTLPDVQLQAVQYQPGDGLKASLVHGNTASLQALVAHLRSQGLLAEPMKVSDGAATSSQLLIRPTP